MRGLAFTAACIGTVLVPVAAYGGGPGEKSKDVAVRYREPPEIVKAIRKAMPANGVCLVLLDADKATKDRGLGRIWSNAFAKAFGDLEKGMPLGLALVEREGPKLVLPPTTDHTRFVAELTKACDAGRDEFRDAMRAVRDLARKYSTPTRPLHLVLISALNVEGESDLAQTLGALRAGRITLHVIGRGAYLSDSYWAANYNSTEARKAPKGVRLRGPEGPTRELPTGWAFDRNHLDNVAPSGWGIYGFARLVAGTRGSYFIWAPPAASARSHCSWNACRLCTTKHTQCDRSYAASYLQLMAPFLGTRAEYARHVRGKPLWKLIAHAWKTVADAGAVQTVPPRLLSGQVPKRIQPGRSTRYLRGASTGSWKGRAIGARRIASAMEKALPQLERAVAFTKRQDAPRAWATAATLQAQILAARFNLRQYARFCDAVEAERRQGFQGEAWELPLIPAKPPNAVGLSYTADNYSYCHGAAWLAGVEWLGGDTAQAELAVVSKVVARNIQQLAGTPYETQNRHLPLAVFRAHWTVRGTATPPPRNRGDLKDNSTGTERAGGPRRGGGSGGSGGGTTTGG